MLNFGFSPLFIEVYLLKKKKKKLGLLWKLENTSWVKFYLEKIESDDF